MWIAVAAVILLVGAGAAVPVYLAFQARQDRDRLAQAVQAYAAAWQGGRFDAVRFTGTDATTAAKTVTTITAGLTPTSPALPAAVTVTSVDEAKGDAAAATLSVRWDLGQNRAWSYVVPLAMKKVDGLWSVAWSVTAVHPRLAPGQVLTASRTAPARGEIIGAGGTVLVTSRAVVNVGIQPRRIKNLADTVTAVAAVVDVDAAALTARIRAAKPDDVVPVITLRRADYDSKKAALQPIPGTVFSTDTLSTGPSAGFARALLGTVGTATKEIVDASGGRVLPGDATGLSGLQRSYDATLTGTAGITVTAGTAQVFSIPPVNGSPVTITIDQKVQQAAEGALAKATKPAAIVAIRPSTGEVLAVANGGPNAAGYDRALIGRYPPGSTFKVVTSYALLGNGFTPTTPVACPPSVIVSGKTFSNAENEVLGTVAFSQDFAQSCNTAFVGSAAQITGKELSAAASALGYGEPNTLGVTAFLGSVPAAQDPVEHAADAIGQGKVLASPLVVAQVSAAIAAGKRVPLSLVTSPLPASSGTPSATASTTPAATASATPLATPSATLPVTLPASPSADPVAATALDAGRVADLQTLMRGVVTSGTGTALANVPGGPVHGKTGTAEFGSANPPQTHAWFTGYQGDLAFAVVVEGGGFGAKAAAPLAAAFLTALA